MNDSHEYEWPIDELRYRWLGSTHTELSLYRLKNKEIKTRPIKVFMIKLGPSSCRFQTPMNIPVREDVEWLLRQQMNHYTAHLNGMIVSAHLSDGWWTYEMKWTMSAYAQQVFEYRLNDYMQTLLVRSPHIMTLYKAIHVRDDDNDFHHLDIST